MVSYHLLKIKRARSCRDSLSWDKHLPFSICIKFRIHKTSSKIQTEYCFDCNQIKTINAFALIFIPILW